MLEEEKEPQSQKLLDLTEALRKESDPAKVLIRSTPKPKWKGTEKFPRSSKFRGVSKNGAKWQVMQSLLNTFRPCLMLKITCVGLSLLQLQEEIPWTDSK